MSVYTVGARTVRRSLRCIRLVVVPLSALRSPRGSFWPLLLVLVAAVSLLNGFADCAHAQTCAVSPKEKPGKAIYIAGVEGFYKFTPCFSSTAVAAPTEVHLWESGGPKLPETCPAGAKGQSAKTHQPRSLAPVNGKKGNRRLFLYSNSGVGPENEGRDAFVALLDGATGNVVNDNAGTPLVWSPDTKSKLRYPNYLAIDRQWVGNGANNCQLTYFWGDHSGNGTIYRGSLVAGANSDYSLNFGIDHLTNPPNRKQPHGIAIGEHGLGYVLWGENHQFELYGFDVYRNTVKSSLVHVCNIQANSAGAMPLAVYSHQSTKKGRIDSVFYLDAEHGLSAINIAFRRLASGTNSAGISLTVSEPIKLCDPSPNEITALFVAKKSRMLYWSAVERSKPSPGVPTERLHSFIAKASIAHDPHCMAACFQQTMQCIEIANIGPAAIAVVDE